MDVEQALRKLGIRGRWQVLHLTIIGVAGSASACFHMLAIIFIGKRLPTLGLRLELVLSTFRILISYTVSKLLSLLLLLLIFDDDNNVDCCCVITHSHGSARVL